MDTVVEGVEDANVVVEVVDVVGTVVEEVVGADVVMVDDATVDMAEAMVDVFVVGVGVADETEVITVDAFVVANEVVDSVDDDVTGVEAVVDVAVVGVVTEDIAVSDVVGINVEEMVALLPLEV